MFASTWYGKCVQVEKYTKNSITWLWLLLHGLGDTKKNCIRNFTTIIMSYKLVTCTHLENYTKSYRNAVAYT